MQPWFSTALDQYETLVRADIEMDRQDLERALERKKNNRAIDAVKEYLRSGFEDSDLRAAFHRIGNLKKKPTAATNNGRKEGPNKTQIVIEVLQKHGRNGLELGEIMDLLAPYELESNRNVVCTMLNRLKRKRRLVAKEGKKYFLTEAGQNMKLDSDIPEQ